MAVVTAAAARKNFCPWAKRHMDLGEKAVAVNREIDDTPWSRCLADKCQAWQWTSAGQKPAAFHRGKAPPADGRRWLLSDGAGGMTAEEAAAQEWPLDELSLWFTLKPDAPRRGYCGAAGRPSEVETWT